MKGLNEKILKKIAALILLPLVFSCTATQRRALIHLDANVKDYQWLPSRTIPKGSETRIFTQESSEETKRHILEVGFSLLEKEIIVRDYITLNGYGGKFGGVPFGEASVGNKFQLGGRVNAGALAIVPYGFLNAEFGLYGSSGKRFFASPFILDVGAGGGFELRYSASEKFTQSFFVEAGGGGMIMLKGTAANSKGYASLALGYRTYF